MRLVFAGTPEFAAAHLEGLIAAGYTVDTVYTQPDRPAGRGRKLRPSPVKALAMEHGIQVRQPPSLRDRAAQQALSALAPDLLIVVAYGLLLPGPVLDTPRLGCINVHASLLPRWRGAAPIQRAICAGDPETGVSIMQMDMGLDTGPVLRVARCPIGPGDTGQTLHDHLAELGAKTLLETLPALEHGDVQPVPQDDSLATYAPKVDKQEARLDWARPAAELERWVRAFNPWPVAWTTLDAVQVRVWSATVVSSDESAPPGRVVAAGPAGIDVSTGAGLLRIDRLQLPGGRPVTAADYLNAHLSPVGRVIGA